MGGTQNNVRILSSARYPGRGLLRVKTKTKLILRLRFLRLGNSALDILGLIFGPGIFGGFVGSPADILGFYFCPLRSSPSLEIRNTPLPPEDGYERFL